MKYYKVVIPKDAPQAVKAKHKSLEGTVVALVADRTASAGSTQKILSDAGCKPARYPEMGKVIALSSAGLSRVPAAEIVTANAVTVGERYFTLPDVDAYVTPDLKTSSVAIVAGRHKKLPSFGAIRITESKEGSDICKAQPLATYSTNHIGEYCTNWIISERELKKMFGLVYGLMYKIFPIDEGAEMDYPGLGRATWLHHEANKYKAGKLVGITDNGLAELYLPGEPPLYLCPAAIKQMGKQAQPAATVDTEAIVEATQTAEAEKFISILNNIGSELVTGYNIDPEEFNTIVDYAYVGSGLPAPQFELDYIRSGDIVHIMEVPASKEVEVNVRAVHSLADGQRGKVLEVNYKDETCLVLLDTNKVLRAHSGFCKRE